MKVLLIEDSERLRRSVGTALRKAGYAVDLTGDGAEGLWFAQSNAYDVIVLDLMLPGLDGLSILQKLRASGNTTHILILTAKDTVQDRVVGLRAGADDYLIKPFALDEFLARVHVLSRRQHGVKNSTLALGDLSIDTASRTVRRGPRLIDLAPREYAILEYLALRQGNVVSRTEIEEHIYDEGAETMSNVVDAAIYSLRKKLDQPDAPSLIQTRRGMGYMVLAEPA